MVCAPNEWVDETGKDPNPHHLHVYTWERLVAEVSAFFLLEQGIFQTAGGALKCPNGDRSWVEFSVNQPPDVVPEWAILLAMADPVAGKDIPYFETTWRLPDSPEFNVAAFERDYANPWLVKGMVAMGMRMRSTNKLSDLQDRVLSSSEHESVDYGAALCGRIYAYIREANLPATVIKGIELDVLRYASVPEPSPHQLRWQVSLLYAAGELARNQGRFVQASKFYSECAARDALCYSPLLGNKTLDSLFWLARFALTRSDPEAARTYLQRSIHETNRLVSRSWMNIVGSLDEPLAFGLAEVSQLFDKAARAAYMLQVIDQFTDKPFLLAQESMGFFERHLDHYKGWGAELHSQLVSRGGQIASLNQTVVERDGQIASLNQTVVERDGQIASLNQTVVERDGQIASLNQTVVERDGQIASLNHMLAYARLNLQLLEQSRSWRITKPLRWATRLGNKATWCLSRFESVRRHIGLAAAIRRSIGFVQTRVPSLARSKVRPHEIQERMHPLPVEQLLKGSHQAKPGQDAAPVLMLVDSFHDGGVERVVIDLCLQFRNFGRPCKVLVAKDGGRSAKEARSHGIEVIEFLHSHSSLEQFLLATSEGIVLTHHCYFALKQFHDAEIPIVEVIHNAYHWQKGNQEIAKYRHDFISSFVSVSEFVRNFSINELGIDPHKVVLINNGLSNVDLIRPPLEILREKRLQTAGEPILLHVANLHPQKNHRLVVNAFAHAKRAYPKARLIMAGAMDGYPELAKALLSDIESLGVSDSIQLAGALDRRELSKTMAAAHIGLLPSMLEGFSIATLEFTFFGLPSVLSATGAADELKTTYGHIEIAEGCALPQCKLSVNAIESLLKDFPDDAVQSLSNAILKILDSYPAYLEKSLLAGASFSGYAIEHTTAQYEQLLTSIESKKCMMNLPADLDIAIVAPFPTKERVKEGWMSRINAVDAIVRDKRRLYINFAEHHARGRDDKLTQIDDFGWEICLSPFDCEHQKLVSEIVDAARIVYTHTIHLAEYIQPWLGSRKIVVDFHGIVPEEEAMLGRPELSLKYEKIEQEVLRNARACVMVTRSMENHYRNKYPEISPRTIILPIVESLPPIEFPGERDHRTELPVRAVYAGGTQVWQNINGMLDLACSADHFANFSFLSHDWKLIEDVAKK